MLNKLLAEIEKGGTLQTSALAVRLEISPALVEMMLEDLERRGKLTRIPTQCASAGNGSCGDCPVTPTCAPRVWSLNKRL